MNTTTNKARAQLLAAADALTNLRLILAIEDDTELRWTLPELDATIDALRAAQLVDLVDRAIQQLAHEFGGSRPDAAAHQTAARLHDTIRDAYPNAPAWRIARALNAMTDALKQTRPLAD